MATSINIDLDGFGFLDDSDDCGIHKLSPATPSTTLKQKQQQPPISPIESESSSGISSLDSDDLKVCFFLKISIAQMCAHAKD
jgi:hypothetical protein